MRGKIKIVVISEQGKEAVVGLFGEGDFFGEGCLIAQPLRLATATTMTDAAVIRVEKAEMIRVLHAEPAFAEVFTAHLLIRNSRIEADLVDHLFNSSEMRLARTLLLLANFGKEGRPEPITTKISQETLAEMVGTTRPRVSFFMNKFRKLGFIDYNGGLNGPQFLVERGSARLGRLGWRPHFLGDVVNIEQPVLRPFVTISRSRASADATSPDAHSIRFSPTPPWGG